MPSPLQKRVLLGLESGAKLHEVLREPHMPSLKMVDEWRECPDVDALFAAAAAAGAAVREKAQALRPRAPARRRCDFSFVGQPITEAGSPDDERRQSLSRQLTAIIGDDHRTPAGRPAVGTTDGSPPTPTFAQTMPARKKVTAEETATRQQQCLALLATGIRTPDILAQITGFSQTKLCAWRKDPEFAAQWDAAAERGRLVRRKAPAGFPVKPRPSGRGPVLTDETRAVDNATMSPITYSDPVIDPLAAAIARAVDNAPVLPSGAEFMGQDPDKKFVVVLGWQLMNQAEAHAHAVAESNRFGVPCYVARVTAVAAPVHRARLYNID